MSKPSIAQRSPTPSPLARATAHLFALALLGPAGIAHAGDKDRDGIPNKADACIEEPEDIDEFEDTDGCPDPDNDLDGVMDDQDRCVNEPEDRDGFEDADGCPDPDNDGDGVVDLQDRCPAEREDADDGDGCATVTLQLLSDTGYLAEIGALSMALVEAAGADPVPCGAAGTAARRLLGADPVALFAEWEARLARAPEGFDIVGATELLALKADVYRTVRPAMDVFCARDPAWSAVAAEVDAVFAPLPVPTKAQKGPRRR